MIDDQFQSDISEDLLLAADGQDGLVSRAEVSMQAVSVPSIWLYPDWDP